MALTEVDREALGHAIKNLAAGWGNNDFTPPPDLLQAAEVIILSGSLVQWCDLPPEVIGGESSDSLSMMLVRKRRQLAYSIKLSNFLRDPLISAGAASLVAFAGAYVPAAVVNPPPTFPGFLIGLAFAVMRSFAHPVGYGEAALLHRMHEIGGTAGIVLLSDVGALGPALVERYGYVKGNNSNEVAAFITSLIAWNAIEKIEGGYRIKESIPFGFGPIEYVD
jgi:hypothetical protein